MTDTGAKPGDAGLDSDIADRLHKSPKDHDAKLDQGIDESMDASDPPSIAQPGKGTDAAPSSGYDADEERERCA